jgi:threonine dehydratase
MLEQLGEAPDFYVLPVGGGGLSSSAQRLLLERAPETEIYFVEPSGGKSLAAALKVGRPTKIESVDTFVDGAAVAKMGDYTFQFLKEVNEDHVLAIPEDRICTTILEMLNIEGIVLEPAGALALDALKDISAKIKGKKVVCVSSGGNFDFERLPEVKERAQRFIGVKKYFILRMPQRPGALKEFLSLLGPDDDISRFEYLKKSARNFGTVLLGIETSSPENFNSLSERLEKAGMSIRDITDDETMVDLII